MIIKMAPRGIAVTVRSAVIAFLVVCICSCTYLKYASVQSEYARVQTAEPAQLNVKHMIEREKYFVHGRCIDATGRFDAMPKAIAAFSSRYKANERVDTMYFQVTGSHYGLNLPEGTYDLLVFADIDGDDVFESSEVIGRRLVELNDALVPQKVMGQVDVELAEPVTVDWRVAIDAPDSRESSESLFYPAGTIRSLDEPIFDPTVSTLGMYDPASFLEQAPTMFYALEEDLGYKIPVIFVHGIGGSARDFSSIVERLDRIQYKPWFFYYPSGGDLEQLAELFYQIFLSGKVYQSGGMPLIVVAHSMGGLIVREAINRYQDKPGENRLHLFVTIASPFGGHPAAASGEKHGLIVLPSWRDLNPTSPFITNLFRKPLPHFVRHELIYAFQNPGTIKLGENSDGVVPLSSQLDPRGQSQSSGQFGFDNTHTDILESDEVISYIRTLMDTVRNKFPESHLRVLRQGGYDMNLGPDYTPVAAYYIRSNGKYLMALTDGTLTPFHPEQSRFVEVARGLRPPQSEVEKNWLRFIDEHPELGNEP
jgi:pimeloyl-ACP methyl ester carboxylesterase